MCIYIEFLDKYHDKVQLVISYAKLFGFPIFRLGHRIPDEDYSRNASCALRLISTFLYS